MNTGTLLQILKPWLAQGARDTLRAIGMYLLSKHIIQGGSAGIDAFVGAGMTFAGFGWGWLTTIGMVKLKAFMKKEQTASMPAPAASSSTTAAVAKVLIAAFVLSMFLASGSAMAQIKKPVFTGDIGADIQAANNRAKAATSSQSTDPEVSCDFHLFILLTPKNLESMVKKCVSDVNSTLADDVTRALDSAKTFPDKDAIACLEPGLAIVKAAIQIPAVPAQDAVPSTATTPAIPAVAAQPGKNPGVILLFQKYREFTMSGALTACQSWINQPIQAQLAAGAHALATGGAVVAGVAALAPK